MVNRKKRGGGRAARQAAQSVPVTQGVPYITRKVPVYEILDEEGLALIENNADIILQEIGVEFRGDADALQLWKDAGADINAVTDRGDTPLDLATKSKRQKAAEVLANHRAII